MPFIPRNFAPLSRGSPGSALPVAAGTPKPVVPLQRQVVAPIEIPESLVGRLSIHKHDVPVEKYYKQLFGKDAETK